MKTVSVNLYEFNELSPKAKEKAREWGRDLLQTDFETEYDDIQRAAELLGITFDTAANTPKIWWQLFVQGSGASFEGHYSFVKQSVENIKSEYPQDEALHRIAEGLLNLQTRYDCNLKAKVTSDGRDVHKYSMALEEVYSNPDVSEDDEKELLELLRDFADWIYNNIQENWDAQMSEEYVDDFLTVNDFWFDANGKRSKLS